MDAQHTDVQINALNTQADAQANTQRYSSEDVQQILTIAMGKASLSSAQLSAEQLREMADELLIGETTLRHAIDEWYTHKVKEIEKQQQRKRFYRQELLPYLGVNTFLILLDISITGGITWSIYPLLGWGASLALGFVTGWSPSLCSCRPTSRHLATSGEVTA